jgi:hypothetical protein
LAKAHLKQFPPIYGFKPQGNPPRKYKRRQIRKRGQKTITIYEHREVMEGLLGRKLTRNEQVHHINGDPQDNRPENLQVLTNAEHQRLECEERRERLKR